MTYGKIIKNKIQNVFGVFLIRYQLRENLLMFKWKVCNLVFVIMLQDKLRKFPFFIINLNPFKSKGN